MRPKREHATNYRQTYMITTETWGRRALFRAGPWARLFIDTLYHYRGFAYQLHEFVVMSDHIHLLITPTVTLEKAVQCIKGGFSYRARKELGSNLEIWQTGFSDHRIRDAEDYLVHVDYIHQNPVRKRLAEKPEGYPFSSAFSGFELDDVPRGLKPRSVSDASGAPEGAPFQNRAALTAEGLPLQDRGAVTESPEGAPFQNRAVLAGSTEGGSLQNRVTLTGPA
jgi:putative transposase